jgi:hypothetical protein
LSRHGGFGIALGIALLISLLLSFVFLLPECAYEPLQQSCMAAKQYGILVYGVAALGFLVLSIGLHLKGPRFATFLAVLGLMIVPFLAASFASR